MEAIGILEITDTAVRLLIGQFHNDEVSVLYTKELPVEDYMDRGEIKNVAKILETVNTLAFVKDDEAKLRLKVTKVIFVLPAIGFAIFETRKSTNVVSATSKIQQLDINNAISLAQKDLTNPGFEVVDVVPELFFIGQDKYTKIPPIGETSRTIAIIARIFALPSSVISTYVRRIIEPSEIQLKRSVVSTVAIEEVCKKSLPKIPDHYLIDIGEGFTKIALVGKNNPVSVNIFKKGTGDLIRIVAEKFHISFQAAREAIENYGIENRQSKFMPPVIESVNEEGLKSVYTLDELSNIIKEFFVEFFNDLDVCITTVKKDYVNNPAIANLPFILTGGVTSMKGLDTLFKGRYPNNEIHILTSNVMGAREQKYIPLIGALLYSSTYKGSLTDSQEKVNQLSREEKKDDTKKKKSGLKGLFGGK